MERLPSLRSRLVQILVVLCASLMQVIAGIMCVPSDLAPQGTLFGWLITQERSWLPWVLIGVNTVVMYTILIKCRRSWGVLIVLWLSLLHGIGYSVVFYKVNRYPSVDGEAVVFFASMYWVFVGGVWIIHWLLDRLRRKIS